MDPLFIKWDQMVHRVVSRGIQALLGLDQCNPLCPVVDLRNLRDSFLMSWMVR